MLTGHRPAPIPECLTPSKAELSPSDPAAGDRLLPRLARLSGHLVIALVILVGIGGATRVMEAGLACPDWPLCYGVLLPGRQMNLQVFLEWFHRLDAFVVGVALLVMAAVSWYERRRLPAWVPWLASAGLALVAAQGLLGALTVTLLLEASTVTAHLATALLLLSLISALHQALHQASLHESALVASAAGMPAADPPSPAASHGAFFGLLGSGGAIAWPLLCGLVLTLLLLQCLSGGWMASHWSAPQCLSAGLACEPLSQHRLGARITAALVLTLTAVCLLRPPATASSRPLALGAALLVALQVALGVITLRLGLSVPAITIAHQITAALLVAVVASLLGQSVPPTVAPSTPRS